MGKNGIRTVKRTWNGVPKGEIMEIITLTSTYEKCDTVAVFAENCSWRAG